MTRMQIVVALFYWTSTLVGCHDLDGIQRSDGAARDASIDGVSIDGRTGDTAVDGEAVDSAVQDAGPSDAGPSDAGPSDAGPMEDGGPPPDVPPAPLLPRYGTGFAARFQVHGAARLASSVIVVGRDRGGDRILSRRALVTIFSEGSPSLRGQLGDGNNHQFLAVAGDENTGVAVGLARSGSPLNNTVLLAGFSETAMLWSYYLGSSGNADAGNAIVVSGDSLIVAGTYANDPMIADLPLGGPAATVTIMTIDFSGPGAELFGVWASSTHIVAVGRTNNSVPRPVIVVIDRRNRTIRRTTLDVTNAQLRGVTVDGGRIVAVGVAGGNGLRAELDLPFDDDDSDSTISLQILTGFRLRQVSVVEGQEYYVGEIGVSLSTGRRTGDSVMADQITMRGESTGRTADFRPDGFVVGNETGLMQRSVWVAPLNVEGRPSCSFPATRTFTTLAESATLAPCSPGCIRDHEIAAASTGLMIQSEVTSGIDAACD